MCLNSCFFDTFALSRKLDTRTNKGQKMYTVENLHPAVVANLKELAQLELNRLAELYKQAGEQFNNSIGKIGEKKNFKIAMEIFQQMETTKDAYRALGITGSVGVHYINAVKVGA